MAVKTNFDTLVTVFGWLGFPRRPCGLPVGQAAMISLGRGTPSRTGRRQLQPLGRVGQIYAVQANVRHQPSSRPRSVTATPSSIWSASCSTGGQRFDAIHAYGAGAVALSAQLRRRPPDPCLRPRRRREFRRRSTHDRRRRPSGPRWPSSRTPSSCGLRSYSAPRTTSSTVLLRSPASRRRCRFPAAAIPAFSRCLPAMWPKRSPRPSTAKSSRATIYELGGPDVRTFKELMEFMLATIGRRRLLLPVPFAGAEAAGGVSAIPAAAAADARSGRALEKSTTSSLRPRVSRAARSKGWASCPIRSASIVPDYLWRFRKTGQFHGRIA